MMSPQHELEEAWFGQIVTRTYWYSFQFALGDGCIEPENQQDEDILTGKEKVDRCRQRYSIFIEPHLNTKKGYFRLGMVIHQFPQQLCSGVEGLTCDKSFQLGYVLKTSEDEKELISFVDDVEFTHEKKFLLILKTRRIPLESLGPNPRERFCTLAIDIMEQAQLSLEPIYSNRLLQAMAEGLKMPNEGDVEFVAKSDEGKEERLYASSRILSSTSEYYKTMFSSAFSEGIACPEKGHIGETKNGKRVIVTDIDFHTLHNILHYFYTNQITFHSKPGKEQTIGLRTVDVQRIYEAADRFLLVDLKDKARDFLYHSCDIQNITARVLGEFATKHEGLRDTYRAFFRTHLTLILGTAEFNEFFENLQEGPESHQINAQFRELVQMALCPGKITSNEWDDEIPVDEVDGNDNVEDGETKDEEMGDYEEEEEDEVRDDEDHQGDDDDEYEEDDDYDDDDEDDEFENSEESSEENE